MNPTIHWLTTAFDGIVAFLPNLIAGLFILLVGYVIARVLARVTRSLLTRVPFSRLLTKLGVVDESDAKSGPRWAGEAVFAIVILATAMQVARAWNLALVASGLAAVLTYVPHILGAVFILAVALFVGNWVRDQMLRRVDSSQMTDELRRIVPGAVRAGILAVGAFMALRELQVAPEIVTIAFAVTLGGIALAAALAFGLGSRSVAGQMTQQWYDHRIAESRPRSNGGRRAEEPPVETKGPQG